MADSASSPETSLLSKLESLSSSTSSDSGDTIFSLFSDHLRPFPDLTKPIPKKNPQQQQTLIRSLAKQYLPFLNRSLSLLPKLLSSPRPDQSSLFKTYELCLCCLNYLSSQLSCKPYSIHIQRLRLIHCYEACGSCVDAWKEGFRVLESLRGIDFGGKEKGRARKKGVLLPNAEDPGGRDKEFAVLVVEIVVTILKCAASGQIKRSGEHEKVLRMVEEVRPWLGVLDETVHAKLHRLFVNYLSRCTQYVASEAACFDGDLVLLLCRETFSEYVKSSLQDEIFKFTRRICSLLSTSEERHSLVVDVLSSLLEAVAADGKVGKKDFELELTELVYYCVNKFRRTSVKFSCSLAAAINKIASQKVGTPVDLILKLYAFGLNIAHWNVKYRDNGFTTSTNAESRSFIRNLLANGDKMNDLPSLLGLLNGYFEVECTETNLSSHDGWKDSLCQTYSRRDCGHEICHFKECNRYLQSYLSALEFLCQPLGELVNLERKHLFAEPEICQAFVQLPIQDVFSQYCEAYLHSITPKHEKNLHEENNKVVLSISVAALTLSFMSKLNMQKSKHFIEHIIGRNVQPEGLKFLYVSLHNLGVMLHRNKLLQEASEALELACLASWTCLRNLCQIFAENGGLGDVSENAILDLFGEICTRSAFHLDILHQCGSEKIEKVILRNLDYWFTAKNLFGGLPGPTALLKQWVKIQCKQDKGMHMGKALHELLSSKKISGGALAIISEQELLMYEEMYLLNPKFCRRMQMIIIDTLIQNVDVMLDNGLQIARLWINKGRIQRAGGSNGLNDCIQSLSWAISSIDKANIKSSLSVCHQLAIAHCLRALCTMEAEPKSKRIFEDLSEALNLWMSAFTLVDIHVEEVETGDVLPDIPLPLIYHVIDILSLKGCISCQENFFKLIIRFFKWKKVPVEKSLAHLWKCRRLSHSLCYSPLSEALVAILLEHYGDVSLSMDYWVHCLRESQPSLIGFQHNFPLLFANAHQEPFNSAVLFRQYINVEEVRQVALELVSSVSDPRDSNFIAAYLCYELCDQMSSYGRLHEALLFAKESHRLRTELFQEYFTYSIEKHADKYGETEQCIQKCTYCIMNLLVAGPVANEVWLNDCKSLNLESCHLSPWNVIQCYLESSLQVGAIHELLGNGTDAETFLLLGKDISCSLDLPHFVVSFSSVLGKIYCKRRLWEMAKAELETAKQLLMDTARDISCFKCRSVLEVNVHLQLGDLFRNQFYHCMDENAADKLLEAEELYKLAIDKLNLSEGKTTATNACAGILTAPNTKVEVSKGRMAKNGKKNMLRGKLNIPDQNKIVTRSMRQSAGQKMCSSREALASSKTVLSGNQCDNVEVIEPFSRTECPKGGFGSKDKCMCNEMGCWRCHFLDSINSRLLSNFILMKWEFIQRRLLLRSFMNFGKCLVERGQYHDAHDMFWKSIPSLLFRNPYGHSSVSIRFLLDLIGKEIASDVFVIERAIALYNICWFFLKSYGEKKRVKCCEFSHIQLSEIVSCLKLAFRLCNEVPILMQKVSRLLAVIYVLSTSKEPFSSLTLGTLSANYWATYFHQASLGSHINSFFASNMAQKSKAQSAVDTREIHFPSPLESKEETGNIFWSRLAPKSEEDLEGFVRSFFMDAPCASVVCISVLSGADACLLRELMAYPSFLRAWILLSRLNSKCQPIAILIPLLPILEDDDTDADCENISNEAHGGKYWHCHWTSSVINDVVPAFKVILEENYISSSVYPLEDTKEARLLWWTRRKNLDLRLGKILRKLEDLWLGSWKCLLMGGLVNCQSMDLLCKKLVFDLKSKCKLDIDEELVSLILRSPVFTIDVEASLPFLQLRSGCYVGNFDTCIDKRVGMQSITSDKTGDTSRLAIQLMHEAADQLNIDDKLFREPIILVLDSEVQMLPWENLPILRSQEVYRVPSFGSISMILGRKGYSHTGKQVESALSTYPSIDPLDAFYLLNPSGDLKNTQVEFENWFRDKKLEGKAGSAPSSEELASALKSHDLFIYFGHGSGVQYISRHEIQKLDSCAATLLMGCSSGSLSLNGSYVPEGASLSYLLAGSPVIVANLWEVTDKDIDRFARAMLDAWMIERLSSTECFQCNSLARQFEAMEIKTCKRNAKMKISSNLPEFCNSSFSDACPHRNRIGSFMAQAREACTLPFLTGASPVCYGVPTCIIRKKNL